MLTGAWLSSPARERFTCQGANPRLPCGQVDPLPLSSQGRPSKDLKIRYFKVSYFPAFFFFLAASHDLWDLSSPTREGSGTHSSALAWKIPWTEEPGGLQSVGSLRVGHG